MHGPKMLQQAGQQQRTACQQCGQSHQLSKSQILLESPMTHHTPHDYVQALALLADPPAPALSFMLSNETSGKDSAVPVIASSGILKASISGNIDREQPKSRCG